MSVVAIVTAGDRRAAKAVYGESKVYLEIDGRPLVSHVVATLQRVPEVSEVWVVGDATRLADVLRDEKLEKPLTIVPQFRNLYENAWETYRRILPDAGPDGRDPRAEDLDRFVLYLSADLPFATPQEISEFVRRGLALECDYAVGLATEEAMQDFYPEKPGAVGIRMAYFNLREGRFRQNNLHLVKPARITNRFYIEEMYEHRYQKQFGEMLAVAWRLLRSQQGFRILGYYLLLHTAALADRWGWRRVADFFRRALPVARVEAILSSLLGTRFRFVAMEFAGCAVDIDNEPDYDAARKGCQRWRRLQIARVEARLGPLPLPTPRAEASLSVLPEGRRP